MSSLDMGQISELKDIMEDAFEDLVSTYLQDCDGKLVALKSALENGDAAKVGELGHSLKGSSLNICAVPLSNIFKQIEENGKQGNLTPISELLIEAGDEYQNVKSALMAL
jgi:HPt (histidine-containing phosphotransfer) domain-containing protein